MSGTLHRKYTPYKYIYICVYIYYIYIYNIYIFTYIYVIHHIYTIYVPYIRYKYHIYILHTIYILLYIVYMLNYYIIYVIYYLYTIYLRNSSWYRWKIYEFIYKTLKFKRDCDFYAVSIPLFKYKQKCLCSLHIGKNHYYIEEDFDSPPWMHCVKKNSQSICPRKLCFLNIFFLYISEMLKSSK